MTDTPAIRVLSLMPGGRVVDTQSGLAVEPFTMVTVRDERGVHQSAGQHARRFAFQDKNEPAALPAAGSVATERYSG